MCCFENGSAWKICFLYKYGCVRGCLDASWQFKIVTKNKTQMWESSDALKHEFQTRVI